MRRALPALRRMLLAEAEVLDASPELASCSISWMPTRQFKKQANDVRPGNILQVDGKLLLVHKFNHAQGAARALGNVTLELRDVVSRSKHSMRVRPSDALEVVRLEEKRMQCLYLDGDLVHCMHADTFEQLAVNASLFGAGARYLAEGQELVLEYFEGEAVAGAVPATVVATVVQVEPHMKGESATQQKKHATLDNGAEVMVPAFVRQGDAVVVDTASGEFLRRAAAPG